ncbi:MAG TPA: alpha/beta hydrolase [Tepidisphaeraceae bacterium]|nr:alpha/beta hydrolase [Tepidisphaeraceae bacterium]
MSSASRAAELKTDVEYGRVGDTRLLLDASVPDGPGPFPAVIVLHGGGWNSGDKQADAAPLLRALSASGSFTWFSINYRLAPANRWPACMDDLHTAIRWVKAHAAEYKADPNRIALMGYSAGGQLVCLEAATAAEQNDADLAVQAVVGIAPPTDFEQDLPQRGGLSKSLQDLLNRPKEVTDESRQLIRSLSAINHIAPGAKLPPFLLVHGTVDKTVPFVQSIAFQKRMRDAGATCDLVSVEGAPHRLSEWEKIDPTYKDKMIDWLKKTLAPAGK